MSKKTKTEVVVPKDAAEVAALTDELGEIVGQIGRLKERQGEIEERLKAWARLQPQAKLEDESREGRRVESRGARSSVAVTFTADLLIGSFQDNSPKHNALLRVLDRNGGDRTAGELLELFFKRPSSWESRIDDGQKFRSAAAEWLQPEVAAAFVAECRSVDKHGIPKSKTVVTVGAVE